jgi:hypothetical protein
LITTAIPRSGPSAEAIGSHTLTHSKRYSTDHKKGIKINLFIFYALSVHGVASVEAERPRAGTGTSEMPVPEVKVSLLHKLAGVGGGFPAFLRLGVLREDV